MGGGGGQCCHWQRRGEIRSPLLNQLGSIGKSEELYRRTPLAPVAGCTAIRAAVDPGKERVGRSVGLGAKSSKQIKFDRSSAD